MEESKTLGSDDFSLCKVEEDKTMKWYDICTIYTTFTIIPTGIMLGVIIAKHFPFYDALKILAIGSSLVIANALLMGFIGYRERTSFALTTRFAFGRHVYAIGGNEKAAELSGVQINKTKILVYSISGFCSAVVGLIIASKLVAAHPATGEFYELTAIAAVVLGGTSLDGGRGSIGGTIIGAFVIGVLTSGLVMMGVSSFWQKVIKGAVIVLAVIIDQVQAKMQDRIALQKQQEIK